MRQILLIMDINLLLTKNQSKSLQKSKDNNKKLIINKTKTKIKTTTIPIEILKELEEWDGEEEGVEDKLLIFQKDTVTEEIIPKTSIATTTIIIVAVIIITILVILNLTEIDLKMIIKTKTNPIIKNLKFNTRKDPNNINYINNMEIENNHNNSNNINKQEIEIPIIIIKVIVEVLADKVRTENMIIIIEITTKIITTTIEMKEGGKIEI